MASASTPRRAEQRAGTPASSFRTAPRSSMVGSSPERGASASYLLADSPISAADMLARARRRKSAAAAAALADASRAGPSTSRIGDGTPRREMASTPYRRRAPPSVTSLLSSPQREAAVRESLLAAGRDHNGLELSRTLDFSPPPEAMRPPSSSRLGSPIAQQTNPSARISPAGTRAHTSFRDVMGETLRTPIANRSNMSMLRQRRRDRSHSVESSRSGSSSTSSTAAALAQQRRKMMAAWGGAREESPMDLLRRLVAAPGSLPRSDTSTRDIVGARASLTPLARRRVGRGSSRNSQELSLARSSIGAPALPTRRSVGGSTSLAVSDAGQGRRQARYSIPENPFANLTETLPAVEADETHKGEISAFARPSFSNMSEVLAEEGLSALPDDDLALFSRPVLRARDERDIDDREREMEALLARDTAGEPRFSLGSMSAMEADSTMRESTRRDSTLRNDSLQETTPQQVESTYARSSLGSASRSQIDEDRVSALADDDAALFVRPTLRAGADRDIGDREREMEALLAGEIPQMPAFDESAIDVTGNSSMRIRDDVSMTRDETQLSRSYRRSTTPSASVDVSQRRSISRADESTRTVEQSRNESTLPSLRDETAAESTIQPQQEFSEASRSFAFDNVIDDYPLEANQQEPGAESRLTDDREASRLDTSASMSVQEQDITRGVKRHAGRLSEQMAPAKRKALATIEEEEEGASDDEAGMDATARKELQAARMALLKKRRVRKRQQRIAPLTGQAIPPLPSSLVRELFCTLATPSVGTGLAGASAAPPGKARPGKAKVERSALEAVEDLSHHFFAQFAHDLVLQAEHKPVPSTRITEADIVALLTAQGHVSQRQPVTSLARKYLPRELSDLLVAAEGEAGAKKKKRTASSAPRRQKTRSPSQGSQGSGKRPALQQRTNRQASAGESYQDDDDEESDD